MRLYLARERILETADTTANRIIKAINGLTRHSRSVERYHRSVSLEYGFTCQVQLLGALVLLATYSARDSGANFCEEDRTLPTETDVALGEHTSLRYPHTP